MAINIGTLLAATARTPSDQDKFPIALANECKGGLHNLNSISERDSIPAERREWGMIVTVSDQLKTFMLQINYANSDISDNLNWVEIPGFQPITNIDGGIF
jgi:hypothetical protein